MDRMNQREQLIEDARTALDNLRASIDGPHPANSGLDSFTLAHISHALDMAEPQIRAVFEGARGFLPVASDVQETAHTDDERGFTATNGIRISSSWTGMTIRDPHADVSEARILTLQSRKAEALRQFFHRTMQGEPSHAGHEFCDPRLGCVQGESSTVQLHARQGGKVQAMIDSLLAQARVCGIRVEVIYPQGEPSDAQLLAQGFTNGVDFIDGHPGPWGAGMVAGRAEAARLRAAAETGGRR